MTTYSTHENDGFILHGGSFVKSITVTFRDTELVNNRRVAIITDQGDTLALTTSLAETLAMDLIKALYDNGHLSMDAAGSLHTMSLTVLQDPREALEVAMMEAGEDF
jgi:nitrogenase molybdenum-iron protein alpha/beta subunit